MAINRIKAGIDLGIREPSAIDTKRRIKHGFGRHDPINDFSGVTPKARRVLNRALIDFPKAFGIRHGVPRFVFSLLGIAFSTAQPLRQARLSMHG